MHSTSIWDWSRCLALSSWARLGKNFQSYYTNPRLTNHSAFNAIISASVVLLDLAYGLPIAVNCIRGRKMLPERTFVLPTVVGWILNIVRTPSSSAMENANFLF